MTSIWPRAIFLLRQLLLIFVCDVALLGCSENVIKSEELSAKSDLNGLTYSLPMGQILITASRTPISPAAVDQAKSIVASDNAQLQQDTALLTGDTNAGGASPSATAQAKIISDQTAIKTDQAALNSAAAALAAAVDNNQYRWLETASLTVLPIVPDPSARFVTALNHTDETRDDTISLTVVNGLLNTTTITSTDETTNIIETIANTAITVAAMAGGALPEAPLGVVPTPSPNCAYSVTRVFNPTDISGDYNSYQAVNAELASLGSTVQIEDSAANDQLPAGGTIADPSNIPGLVYRLATPVFVRVVPSTAPTLPAGGCGAQAPVAAQSIETIVPDTRSRYVVSSKAEPFTTNNLTFGFLNGMLTNYSAQAPSEIAAVAGIPLAIANNLMQIPGQVFQYRVNSDTAATALVNQQTALKTAEIQQAASVANAQAAVVNAQAGLKQAEIQQTATIEAARTAVVNAQTALSQAQLGQPTAVAQAQEALIQAQAALQSAEQSTPPNPTTP